MQLRTTYIIARLSFIMLKDIKEYPGSLIIVGGMEMLPYYIIVFINYIYNNIKSFR